MVIIASVAKSSVVSPAYSPYRFACNDDPNLKCRLDAEQGGGRADHQIFLAEVELHSFMAPELENTNGRTWSGVLAFM
jgi:hypothetical protein